MKRALRIVLLVIGGIFAYAYEVFSNRGVLVLLSAAFVGWISGRAELGLLFLIAEIWGAALVHANGEGEV